MGPQYFVVSAIGVGIGIPIIWLFTYWAILEGNPALMHSVMSVGHLDKALMAIWPSSLFLGADPEDQSVAIPIVSIAVNAVLYGGLGWLVWFGLYRNRIVLAGTVLLIVIGWCGLFSWYAGR